MTGYYNGFADDLAKYIQKHRSRTEAEKKKQIGKNKSSRKYTLGDIYMKQELNSKSITDCKNSSEKRDDHKLLPNRIKKIFNIPKIYQDLKSMPKHTFKKTLKNAKKSKDGLTPMQVGLLKYLYRILYCKKSKCKKNIICICNKYLSPLENAIILTGRESNNYSREELYKEAYEEMIIFYKHARYLYKSKDKKKIIEMMGKNVIVEQACMKCEAIVAKGTGSKAHYRMVSAVEYIPMSHHWNISTKLLDHYHVQFVDNSLHTLRRVCLPFFKISTNSRPTYIHTISDIIKYLAQIYNIEEIGKIYALLAKKGSSKWRFLTDKEKKHTIKYFNEMKKFSVVFYYIKEGIQDKSLTPCVFKELDSEEKNKQQIPLFLSPFMKCAIEQLGLCTKEEEKKKDSAEKPKLALEGTWKDIHVYECTNPDNDKPGSVVVYSQIQLYYSRFYIHEKIKERTELRPILSTSIEKIRNTKKILNKKEEKQRKLTWYVRAPGNRQEYTHYSFDKPNGSGERKGQPIIITILTSLKEKNRTTNNPAYAFYTAKRKKIPYEIFFFQ